MAETSIEWTNATWNPVRGCSRVSPGCDNCFAMCQAHRFSGPGKPYEGLTTIRRGKVDWTGSARLVPSMLEQPLRWKKPRRIFVNSMSDLFHESLSDEDIDRVFAIMARCPQHTFQVLTKRPKRMLEYFADVQARSVAWEETDEIREAQSDVDGFDDNKTEWGLRLTRQNEEALQNVRAFWDGVPLPNVWLGVSAENQEQADKRIPLLLQCPAAVRFVSAEPLLGPIDLIYAAFDGSWGVEDMGRLDWVIVGGESGHGARPCNVEWIRSIVKQCGDAGVPVFVKQLGAEPVDGHGWRDYRISHNKGGNMLEWPDDLRVREFPEVRP